MTPGMLLLSVARRIPGRVAVRAGGTERTYGDLFDNAARFAGVLTAHGVRAGDRVALMMDNRVEALECYLGCLLGGYTAVHVNDRLARPEVQSIVDDAGVAAFVAPAAGRFDPAAGSGRPVSAPVVLEPVFDAAPIAPRLAPPSAPAIIGYTSGTTGAPKGVVITQENLSRIIRHMPVHDGLRPGSRCAFTGSFSFVAGIWGVMLPHLYLGGELSFMAGLPPAEWVDRMIRERSTFTYVPSPLAPAFTEEVRRRPEVLGSLTGVLHSASAMRPEVMRDLVSVIGDRFVETWGMTETGAPVTTTVPADWTGACEADDIYASAGRPAHIAAVRVIGPDGADVPAGGEGELLVQSETLFAGYFRRPEATSEALRDGWLHTGDIGRVDRAGYVYITDRLKDMIVTGGMNVYPAEVEQALSRMPGVAEAAVFGAPDERWGETVVAAIVRAPGHTFDEAAVTAWCRQHLASYKKPTSVLFLDALPRNAALKVPKPRLRELYARR
ncbi:class I adenylate-forming enzyme family protein [Dactylosporangium sp. McL0621]|uniref:class I adenylate-forming enzyme family protein n=1 Tax=Dactylosporangium sp. McL0621 TaxID=3415678 RepID=UPI003CF45283